jgi:hypothetical protein
MEVSYCWQFCDEMNGLGRSIVEIYIKGRANCVTILKCALIDLDAFSTHKYLGQCVNSVFSCIFYNAVCEHYGLLGYEVMCE